MSSKRKPTNFRLKIADLSGLLLLGIILYATLGPRFGHVFAALLIFVIFMIWIMFFMATKCDFELQSRPGGCESDVRGKLRGCNKYNHDRRKRDAVWAAFRMRNPGLIFRVMWTADAAGGTRMGGGGGDQGDDQSTPPPSRQTASEITMLVATVVGSLAAVLALFIH